MADLRANEMKFIVRTLAMEDGYVLDFTDATFAEFFALELKVDIDEDRRHAHGSSKAKRLRAFLLQEPDDVAARALRALWAYRAELPRRFESAADREATDKRAQEIIQRLAGAGPLLAGALERFSDSATLDDLVAAIERDVAAGKPHVALDRLHTYCMKKFAHLLRSRGETVNPKEPLNGRAGRYLNPLRKSVRTQPITDKILRNTVETFELLNGVRNDASLAHDNELIDPDEAQFIFESVLALLRFVKSREGAAFDAVTSVPIPDRVDGARS